MAKGTYFCIRGDGQVQIEHTIIRTPQEGDPSLLYMAAIDRLQIIHMADKILFVEKGSSNVWLLKDRFAATGTKFPTLVTACAPWFAPVEEPLPFRWYVVRSARDIDNSCRVLARGVVDAEGQAKKILSLSRVDLRTEQLG